MLADRTRCGDNLPDLFGLAEEVTAQPPALCRQGGIRASPGDRDPADMQIDYIRAWQRPEWLTNG